MVNLSLWCNMISLQKNNLALANSLNVSIVRLSLVFFAVLILGLTGCSDPNTDNANLNEAEEVNNNASRNKPNVVSPDWGVTATLIAMGHPPIATGDTRVWDQWVAEPKLPASVHDLGIRYLPNAELAAQLPVDLIVDNFFYEHSRGIYGDIPAQTVMFAGKGDNAKWSDYVEPTRQLGEVIDKPQQAERYIDESRQRISAAGEKLQQRYPDVKKFAVVQFADANNMRMYSNNSLFNVVLNQMGGQLVALDKGNEWGFVPIQMGDLAQLDSDVCLLVIRPFNAITQKQIESSLVWQRLGYGLDTDSTDNSRCMAILPPVWIYGGMASLTSLADNLVSANLVGGPAHDNK